MDPLRALIAACERLLNSGAFNTRTGETNHHLLKLQEAVATAKKALTETKP